MSSIEFPTSCRVSPDGKHEPIDTPIWFDEDDEVTGGLICKACGEELDG